MEINAILCNHAESVENKLYLSGGGINMCLVGPQPPFVISVGLGIVIHVPYMATNQTHRLLIVMIDEDGVPVVPYHPEGIPRPNPVRVEIPFTLGRPDILAVGDEQTISIAANFPNLPMAEMGLYTFIFEIDGAELRRLPFRVLLPPAESGSPPQVI